MLKQILQFYSCISYNVNVLNIRATCIDWLTLNIAQDIG